MLSANKKELLYKYFKAVVEFYQLIPLKKAYEIFCIYRPDYVDFEEFLEAAEGAVENVDFFYLVGDDEFYDNCGKTKPEDRKIANESVVCVSDDIFYEFDGINKDIPDKILSEKELMKYTVNSYYYTNEYTDKIAEFLRNVLKINSDKKIDNIIGEITLYLAQDDSSSAAVIKDMLRMRVPLTKETSLQFAELYEELEYDYPLVCNRGNTWREMEEMGFKQPEREKYNESMFYNLKREISEMLNDVQEMRENISLINFLNDNGIKPFKTPSKNGPCPCGSGKKYKRCCGKTK